MKIKYFISAILTVLVLILFTGCNMSFSLGIPSETPDNITLLGETHLETYFISGKAIYKNYIILAGQHNTYIIDIADPAAPTPVYAMSYGLDKLIRLDVKGDYLYLVDTKNLEVYDLMDPSAPVLKSSIPLYGGRNIKVEGDTLYGITANGVLHLFSITEPANPRLLKTIELPYKDVQNMLVYNNHAYIVAESNFQTHLVVVDAANPAAPSILHTIPNLINSYGNPIDTILGSLAVSEGHLYIQGSDIIVVDIRTPGQAAIVNTIHLYKESIDAMSLADDGRLFIIKSNNKQGIYVMDISDPTSAEIVNGYTFPTSIGYCKTLILTDTNIFLFSSFETYNFLSLRR